MQYLSNWILDIVMFIILAILIDLLLPNSKMKKYVQFVLGIILIVIFLTPLFKVFDIDVSTAVTSSIDEIMFEINKESSLIQIENKKSEIEKAHHAYVLKEMVVHMNESVEEGLKDEYMLQIEDMNIETKKDAPLSEESIEKITIILISYQNETINDIPEVDININNSNLDKREKEPKHAEEIKEYLASQWEIEKEILELRWKEDESVSNF
ncbi:stage III sporulation protein AF [Saliterribacillus persicus]|uniref:Stage III sporulation protein AF n=1 Tax=Saliterribacillus persicus TaxID=930114 RepID=A0A368XHB3_9BACI|nr:stage III sporulation protein AF [Saliterribacillus persicus]RCW65404.1 stage III sporulation protein AF [Saliterribacillus persicus]